MGTGSGVRVAGSGFRRVSEGFHGSKSLLALSRQLDHVACTSPGSVVGLRGKHQRTPVAQDYLASHAEM